LVVLPEFVTTFHRGLITELAENAGRQSRKGGSEECRRCDYPDLERVKADFGEISGQDNDSKAVPKPRRGTSGRCDWPFSS